MATYKTPVLVAGVFTTVLLGGCGALEASPEPTSTVSPRRSIPESPSPQASATTPAAATPRLTLADAEQCPVTQPTSAPPEIGERLFGWGNAYGNDALWVGGLGEEGIYAVDESYVRSDGSIGVKLGWWRNVPGSVIITGLRLDAPGPPLSGQGSDGYGRIGFQASGVGLPTEGCWEITGSVGESELTFVMFVFARADT